MVGLAGVGFNGIPVGGEIVYAGVHVLYLTPEAGHFFLLSLNLHGGLHPGQNAVIGKEEQPQRDYRRDYDDERYQIIMLFLLEYVCLETQSGILLIAAKVLNL